MQIEESLSGIPENVEQPSSSESTTIQESPEIVDLGKLERFVYDGEERDSKWLKSAIMRQADYSRKTATMAQERKYSDNLPYDLKKLVSEPWRIDEFKKTYPEKYHVYLDFINSKQQDNPKSAQKNVSQYPDEIQDALKEISSFRNEIRQEKLSAFETNLNSIYTENSKQYPHAGRFQKAVTTEALAFLDQKKQDALLNGEDPNKVTISKREWGLLFKSVDDELKSMIEAGKKETFSKQRMLNEKGKDIGAGGGTPSHGRKEFTGKDAIAKTSEFLRSNPQLFNV